MLAYLTKAWSDRSKVRITYATASRNGEVSERVVHPYYLLPYVRSWQLIAYCERRGDVRMFKLDRIQTAELLPASYTIPDDFDVNGYLNGAWGMMRSDPAAAEDRQLAFCSRSGAVGGGGRMASYAADGSAGRWHAPSFRCASLSRRSLSTGCCITGRRFKCWSRSICARRFAGNMYERQTSTADMRQGNS
jgi:hypothetical protein